MKAQVINKRGVTIVSFEGFLNFSHPLQLKENLQKLYATKRNKKLVFNLEKLEFVGSTGIKDFIEVLRFFNKDSVRPKFVGLSPEYQKLFRAFERGRKFHIFDSEFDAIRSYRLVKKPARA